LKYVPVCRNRAIPELFVIPGLSGKEAPVPDDCVVRFVSIHPERKTKKIIRMNFLSIFDYIAIVSATAGLSF